jgi:hypothetical protein
MSELSLREIASRYLGISGGFSVTQDIFRVSQVTSPLSLRAKLEESLAQRVYTISEPNVRQRMTEYRDIRFQRGDRITVEAGGCVDTGGAGDTWKRYVDPSGDETAWLYHGLLWIPGATLPLQRMRYCNGRTFEIPLDAYRPENLYLRLGYEDDDYSDNGYDDHDDGTEDQCRGIGSAFVRLTVEPYVSGRPVSPLPSPAPLDVVWRSVDVNGLPLNPKWGAQVTNRGQPGFDPPNVDAISPRLTNHEIDVLHRDTVDLEAGVTTQAPYYNWKGTGWPFTCPGGHANWAAVTYEGVIRFKNFSGGAPNDGDYNLLLRPITSGTRPRIPYTYENSGLVQGNGAPPCVGDQARFPNDVGEETLFPDGALLLEFDAGETVDDFESPWWETFHEAVDEGHFPRFDYQRVRNMVNNRYAIVTGLLGMDFAYDEGPWTEVHPVWALAIRVNDDEADETWAIFVRNWGNEGACGNFHDEYLSLPGNRYTFRLPWRQGMTGVTAQRTPNDFHLEGSGTRGPNLRPVPGEGVFVEFTLPEPKDEGFINGALRLAWQ